MLSDFFESEDSCNEENVLPGDPSAELTYEYFSTNLVHSKTTQINDVVIEKLSRETLLKMES